jgi:hypothetical protein
MKTPLAALVIAALFASRATGAGAGDLSLVLDRRENAVELYLAGLAPLVLALFGGLPAGEQGAVDPDRWRVAGSFDFADALIAGTSVRIGGAADRFEAMSAMLHPESDPLPLHSPLDGMIAIAVCTAPDAGNAFALEESRLYLGYIAYAGDTGGEIDLGFAAPLGQALSIEVRDHADGELLAVYRLELEEGSASLFLRGAPEGLPPPAWIALAALLFNAVFAGGAILRSRRAGKVWTARGAISGS